MRRMKKLTLMLVMMLSTILLSGCFSANTGIVMNKDGSGTFEISFLSEDKVPNLNGAQTLLENGFTEDFVEAGGEIKTLYSKKIAFKTPAELQKMLTDGKVLFDKLYGYGSFGAGSKFLNYCYVTKDTFQGVVLGTGLRGWGFDDEDFEDAEDKEFLEDLKGFYVSRIGITFQDEILNHNGKLSKDKKTVTWTFDEEKLSDTLLRASTKATPSYPKDTKKPVIKGVKDGAYYADLIEFSVEDNVGIKSATINGIPIGHEDYVYNAAKYTVTAKDFDGNISKVTFYIDYKAPTVSGVAKHTHYKSERTIKFTDNRAIQAATLNGKLIKSGTKVSKEGSYVLVVADKAGNSTVVRFAIDKTAPKVSGVSHGKTYKGSRTIKFTDNKSVKTATLNGKAVKSGTKVSKKGNHTLKVSDRAGNVTTVRFTIK